MHWSPILTAIGHRSNSLPSGSGRTIGGGNHFVIMNNETGFNGHKDCVNGASLELSLPKGITKQTLEPNAP